ncbi:MAG: heme-binding protein [Opitutales bacterium]|nr:heme-binding protein [Opitutales bacterium]
MSVSPATATDAFARTEADVMEIKHLPGGILLESTAEGAYFENSNRLFRPLFRYISRHDIAMTTPVEARMEPGAMLFWVAPSEEGKVAGDEEGVRVIEQPPRTVGAIGGRGAYSERNFHRAEDALRAWLAEQEAWEIDGEAYGVFWHGPFTPWFRKQFEVHIPVRPAAGTDEVKVTDAPDA